MAPTDAGDLDGEGRSVDQLTLEDGTLVIYDPEEPEAWVQCRPPVPLHHRT